jgi:dienelactone hydrolase
MWAGRRAPLEELRFRSDDGECAATLHRPGVDAPGGAPCVVMGNGVSMTRRDGLPRFAERFAAAGFAALTFDFRHLGDSGGEPRQLVDFKRQRTDFAAAVAFARTIDGIDADRVAVWGFSLGGGIAVYVAAGDDRLAAAITLCPGADGLAFTLAADLRTNARQTAAAVRALLNRRTVRLPVTGPPGSIAHFRKPEAMPGIEAVRAEDSLWRNELRAKPLHPPARFRPVRVARRVRCPLLVCLGSNDTLVPSQPIVRTAQRAPHGELRRYPINHFGGFLDGFEDVASDQVEFLNRHLAPPGGD